MRPTILAAAVLLAVQTHSVAADPAAASKGVQVLPKLGAVVKVGSDLIDEKAFELPWIVQDVNGEWLWVGQQRKGWVQRSQVVTLDEAPAYYTQLIDSNQQKAWAYNLRATAWDKKGDPDSAISDYGESLRLSPQAAVYNNRGNAWDSKQDFDKAIADFSQAIRLDPNNATAYFGRGNAWKAKKDYDKTIADYNAALRLNPNDAYVFNNAAWLRATCSDARYRDGRKAVALATKACELTGWADFNWLDTLAAAYAEAGDFDSAIKYESKTIELNSTDAEFVKRARERMALYNKHQAYREE